MTTDEPDPDCPSTTRHGTRAASQHHGCTCPAARAAATRYTKQWRLAQLGGQHWLIPADGTRRRLQALYAAGWPALMLAPMLGLTSKRSMDRLVQPVTVRRTTAARVAAVYEELSGRQGPSKKAAAVARRYGHLPPIAWDDNIDDPAALPYEELLPDGTVRSRWRPCLRDGCRQYAPGVSRYCTERCRSVGDAAGVVRRRVRDRARAAGQGSDGRLGVAS